MRYLLIICTIFLGTLNAQAEGIQFFKGSWQEVLEEGRQKGKIVFVDAYTTWCGPCKKMSLFTFKDKAAAEYYNDKFINYKLDMEKGEGPEFKAHYGVRAYPTLLFIDPNSEEVVYKFTGFRKPDQFINEGKMALLDEQKVEEFAEKYENGERSTSFLYEYIELLTLTKKPAKDVIETYLLTQPSDSLINKKNMELILNGSENIESPLFDLLLTHKPHFEEAYGKNKIDFKLMMAARNGVDHAINRKKEELFEKSKDVLKLVDTKKADQMSHQLSLKYYQHTADWKSFSKTAVKYVDNFNISDPALLNNIAWAFYENVSSRKQLKLAKSWAEKSVAIKSGYHNNDTLAALLFKLGDKAGAMEAAERAITIAKYSKMKEDQYAKTLELMDKL